METQQKIQESLLRKYMVYILNIEKSKYLWSTLQTHGFLKGKKVCQEEFISRGGLNATLKHQNTNKYRYRIYIFKGATNFSN